MNMSKKEYNRYVARLAQKSPLGKDLLRSFLVGGLICVIGQLILNGFANAVVSPAIEFKAEGFVTGMAAKMFIIAGPVIVYGTVASVLYGLILVIFGG